MSKEIKKPLDWKEDWLYDKNLKKWLRPHKCEVCDKCYMIVEYNVCLYGGPYDSYFNGDDNVNRKRD